MKSSVDGINLASVRLVGRIASFKRLARKSLPSLARFSSNFDCGAWASNSTIAIPKTGSLRHYNLSSRDGAPCSFLEVESRAGCGESNTLWRKTPMCRRFQLEGL